MDQTVSGILMTAIHRECNHIVTALVMQCFLYVYQII